MCLFKFYMVYLPYRNLSSVSGQHDTSRKHKPMYDRLPGRTEAAHGAVFRHRSTVVDVEAKVSRRAGKQCMMTTFCTYTLVLLSYITLFDDLNLNCHVSVHISEVSEFILWDTKITSTCYGSN